MSETVNIERRNLDHLIPQWRRDFGTELVTGRDLKVDIQTYSLPQGQAYTTQNLSFVVELDELSREYESDNQTNGTVLTLQLEACKYDQKKIDLKSADGGNLTGPWPPRHTRPILSISLIAAGYFEAAAYADKKIPGLNNPNAVVVSVIARTRDRYWIFTQRPESAGTGKNLLGVVGGTLEKQPKLQVIDEIREELGIPMPPEDDTQDMYVSFDSLCLDQLDRHIFIYDARIPFTKEQVESYWSRSPSAVKENPKIIFIKDDKEAIIEFAKINPPDKFHEPGSLIFAKVLKRRFMTQEEDDEMGGMSG